MRVGRRVWRISTPEPPPASAAGRNRRPSTPAPENHRMEFTQLHDRDRIEAYLRRLPDTHVYSLGDLDDVFWPHTRWYGVIDADEIRAISLVFSLYDPPIVLAISEPDN